MYPRLHHANVGIRTRFIDQCLDRVIVEEGETGLNVLILGAGFDSRGVRLLKEGDTRVVELDLEKVIKEKEQVYARNYQRRQRGGENGRGAKRRAENAIASDENLVRSYFSIRHACPVIIVPKPKPFGDSLRSSQEVIERFQS